MLNEFNFLFNNSDIHVYPDLEGNLWFSAPDVARVLGYSDSSHMLRMIPDNEKLTSTLWRSGQNRNIWLINEMAIYRIAFNSRRPEAIDLQNKVFYDILPCIRKYGAYIDPNTRQQLEANPELIHDINANIDNHEKKRMYHLIYPDSTEYRNIQKIRELQTDNRDLRRYNNKAKIMYQNLQDSYDHLQDLLSDPSDLSNFD